MVRMMGLLSNKLERVNADYILILHALELLGNETNDDLPTVSAFLINNDFNNDVPTYRKTFTGKIDYDDDGFGGTFQKTYEVLHYFHNANPHHFYESGYRECYWLKEDFFNFLIAHEIKHIPSVIDWIKSKQHNQVEQSKANITLLQRDHYLTHLDIFSLVEASCLVSDDDPIQIEICRNDTNFWQNYNQYLKAESFIIAGIKSGKLDSDITSQSLKYFLKEKDIIIYDFNDNLPASLPTTESDLLPLVNDLQSQLTTLQEKLNQATAENQQQADTIQQLNERLASQPEPTAEPMGDKDLNTKSQNTVAKILKAVLDIADLNTNDPYSYDNPTSTNYFIYNQLIKNKMQVKPQTIGKWIELASQQTTDK